MEHNKIVNKEELDQFIWDVTQKGHVCKSIKGKPPIPMFFKDGSPISSINIGWFDATTGEQIDIVYEGMICQ